MAEPATRRDPMLSIAAEFVTFPYGNRPSGSSKSATEVPPG